MDCSDEASSLSSRIIIKENIRFSQILFHIRLQYSMIGIVRPLKKNTSLKKPKIYACKYAGYVCIHMLISQDTKENYEAGGKKVYPRI